MNRTILLFYLFINLLNKPSNLINHAKDNHSSIGSFSQLSWILTKPKPRERAGCAKATISDRNTDTQYYGIQNLKM